MTPGFIRVLGQPLLQNPIGRRLRPAFHRSTVPWVGGGVMAAGAFARLLSGFLCGVTATSPGAYLVAGSVLVAVTLRD